MRLLGANLTLLLLLAAPAAAQDDAAVHAAEWARLDLPELRPGASGDASAPDAANSDEAQVGTLTPPPLFTSETQRTPQGWPARRAELARLVEDHWVGRMPEAAASFRVVWRKEVLELRAGGGTREHWLGQVIAPDGRMGPGVDAILTLPETANGAPALIDYTYIWPGGRTPDFGGAPAPDGVAMALERGFVHVAYRPQLLQADNAREMAQGLIGLARWPRERHDWGALRAWAWGASALREALAADPRIDAARISLAGHSRFGKGALVAAAFDHAFADAHVSSSGAGGAKLMRRDFGERWANMAGIGAFQWFAPDIMTYAAGDATVADLPVDAHMLIALRAPRPLLVTSGLAERGDAWVDPRGMWEAVRLAQPAWEAHDAPTPRTVMPRPEAREQLAFPLAWYQHGEGHVPWPAWDEFYEHEARFAGE